MLTCLFEYDRKLIHWKIRLCTTFRISGALHRTNTLKKLLTLFPNWFAFFFSLFHNSVGSGCWMQRKLTPCGISSTRWQDYRCGIIRSIWSPTFVFLSSYLNENTGCLEINHLLSRKRETKDGRNAAAPALARSMDVRSINSISTVLMRKHDADQSFPADTQLIQPFSFLNSNQRGYFGPEPFNMQSKGH